jgi:hypothetical protein
MQPAGTTLAAFAPVACTRKSETVLQRIPNQNAAASGRALRTANSVSRRLRGERLYLRNGYFAGKTRVIASLQLNNS